MSHGSRTLEAPLLGWLACPACRGALSREDGALRCAGGHRYEVQGGVPVFCPALGAAGDLGRTADAFEARWRRYFPQGGYMASSELLLDYLSPAGEDFLRGKDVLDAGCGMGRFARLAAAMGARTVIGVDLIAGRPLGPVGEDGWHRVQADLERLPFSRPFDFVMSLGVLHHLPDPAAGFRALAGQLKPGGHLAVWVYGRENNGWIRALIDPLRLKVTSRLPDAALHRLCLLPAAVLYWAARFRAGRLALRLVGGKALDRYARTFVARLTFWETAGVVYDHLVAPHAHYLSEAQVRRYFEDSGLELVSITSRNGNSWRALGRRPA